MFGFSLQKLLVLVAIIGAVWYGFKLVSRMQAAREANGAVADKTSKRRKAPKPDPAEPEDMVQCSVCQAFVAVRGASPCGRADCPY